MPSFSDSIFLFILALLLFGPKKLPVLARELGKWVGEFRRASNEFKMQMEEELRAVEQADRQKQIAAMEAAAPVAAIPEPEHPHLDTPALEASTSTEDRSIGTSGYPDGSVAAPNRYPEPSGSGLMGPEEKGALAPDVLPIATSGDLSIMPPATGLPTPRSASNAPLGSLLDSIPSAETASAETEPTLENRLKETALHGD